MKMPTTKNRSTLIQRIRAKIDAEFAARNLSPETLAALDATRGMGGTLMVEMFCAVGRRADRQPMTRAELAVHYKIEVGTVSKSINRHLDRVASVLAAEIFRQSI